MSRRGIIPAACPTLRQHQRRWSMPGQQPKAARVRRQRRPTAMQRRMQQPEAPRTVNGPASDGERSSRTVRPQRKRRPAKPCTALCQYLHGKHVPAADVMSVPAADSHGGSKKKGIKRKRRSHVKESDAASALQNGGTDLEAPGAAHTSKRRKLKPLMTADSAGPGRTQNDVLARDLARELPAPNGFARGHGNTAVASQLQKQQKKQKKKDRHAGEGEAGLQASVPLQNHLQVD